AGKTMVIGWGDHLFRIDPSTMVISEVPLPALDDRSPSRTGMIQDIAADGETVWIARAGVASLAAIDSVGNVREYRLPKGEGSPYRITVDSLGHVWSSVVQHDPRRAGAGSEAVTVFAVTVEL